MPARSSLSEAAVAVAGLAAFLPFSVALDSLLDRGQRVLKLTNAEAEGCETMNTHLN